MTALNDKLYDTTLRKTALWGDLTYIWFTKGLFYNYFWILTFSIPMTWQNIRRRRRRRKKSTSTKAGTKGKLQIYMFYHVATDLVWCFVVVKFLVFNPNLWLFHSLRFLQPQEEVERVCFRIPQYSVSTPTSFCDSGGASIRISDISRLVSRKK